MATTDTLDGAIAAAAIIGLSTPAAARGATSTRAPHPAKSATAAATPSCLERIRSMRNAREAQVLPSTSGVMRSMLMRSSISLSGHLVAL